MKHVELEESTPDHFLTANHNYWKEIAGVGNEHFSVLSRSRSLGLLNPKNIGFLILTFKRPSVYIKSILNCWMYINIRQYTLTVARGTMFKCGVWRVCYCAFESRRKSKFKVAGEVTKCLVKVWRHTTSQKPKSVECRLGTYRVLI